MENELNIELRKLEELNYLVGEPNQEKKKEIVVRIMSKLAEKEFYSTILNKKDYKIGRITRNALIAYALCGGRWSEYSERYSDGK